MKRAVLVTMMVLCGCGGASSVAVRPTTGTVVRSVDRSLTECQPDASNCTPLADLAMSPMDAAATDGNLYFVDGSTTLYVCNAQGGGCNRITVPFDATGVDVGANQQAVVISRDGRRAICSASCSEVAP